MGIMNGWALTLATWVVQWPEGTALRAAAGAVVNRVRLECLPGTRGSR